MELNLKRQPFGLTVNLVDAQGSKSQLSYELTAENLDETVKDAIDIVERLSRVTTARVESYSITIPFWNATAENTPQNSSVYKVAQVKIGISSYQGRDGKYTAETLTIPSPVSEIFTNSSLQQINVNHPELKNYVAIFQGDRPKALLRNRKYVATDIKGGYWESRKSPKPKK